MITLPTSGILTVWALACLRPVVAQGQSGSHTNLPRWCGKPYEPGSPNYNPGGQLYPPAPSPSVLLDVQVAPRYSIYVGNETEAEFIVDAALSNYHGAPYGNPSSNGTQPFDTLYFDIRVQSDDEPLVAAANISVNSTGVLYPFALSKLSPRMQPYPIVLYGASSDGNQSYTATTELFYLPEKGNGSVTKVDNLNGGLMFRNNNTDGQFEPIFPHGFYTTYSGYLDQNHTTIQDYADYGFQMIHPIGTYSHNISTSFAYMDQINLLFQYDMRGIYQNLSNVTQQVNAIKDYSALLMYYTADEPDGNQDPLNATLIAYNTIGALDKYHPISLVLNCANYYFDSYARGTDVLMVDPYPIGINSTFSKWGTACNATYGDCGCDDCLGELQDVPDRMDAIANYQSWLNDSPTKPNYIVPQSFSGEGYWSRDPTPSEVWTMNTLAINHGAKGIVSWTYPTAAELEQAHATQAKVLTRQPVLGLLTGTQPQPVSSNGAPLVDAAIWRVGSQALVSIATADYIASNGTVTVDLPFPAQSIVSQPWGNTTWALASNGQALSTPTFPGLGTSLVILDL